MNWKRIKKEDSVQPQTGTYSDWKEQIAEECYYQCIYCSIHETQFGGIDHYHIEHYKPKSIERFKELENDITNLFYSCPICNRFKSNDWPNDADDLSVPCYPDPSEHDYSELFNIDSKTYKVSGLHVSTTYMTERLFLNRVQLIYERREYILKQREKNVRNEIEEIREKHDHLFNIIYIKKYLDATVKLSETIFKEKDIRPYRLEEIRK
ncbi:MAG: HNH endonuclease [Flavobacteriaceae bacterium]|nr:HNH endonuclease [Flavobacteriaceae bacterium]